MKFKCPSSANNIDPKPNIATDLAPAMDDEKVEEAGVGEEEVEVQSSPLHLHFKNLFSNKHPAAPETQEIYRSCLFDKFTSCKVIMRRLQKNS